LDTSGGLQAGTSVKRIEEATPSSHQCIGGDHMQIILLEDVRSLGKAGDLVKVSDGYGRNFLIPQKKAILATEKGVKMLEHQKRQVQARMGKMKKNLKKSPRKSMRFPARSRRRWEKAGNSSAP